MNTTLADATEVVLDTNVVLDWLVFAEPAACALGARILAGRLRWVRTPSMHEELRRVLGYDALQTRGVVAGQVLRQALQASQWRDEPGPLPWPRQLRCTDPDDQVFIDLALSHRIPWLISRDKAVLRLSRRARDHGVQILSPIRWLALQTALPPC